MKLVFCLLFLIFCSSGVAQEKSFLIKNEVCDGGISNYYVATYTIHNDSTYTYRQYNYLNKKDWRSFTEIEPTIIENGILVESGKYFDFIEIRSGKKIKRNGKFKMSENLLIYYFDKGNGKMGRGAVYKLTDRLTEQKVSG